MKPYYEDGNCVIYHGDCREILPTLEKVDLLLTDPPYGMNWNTDSRRFSRPWGRSRRGKGNNHNKVIGDGKPFEPSEFYPFATKHLFWGSNHFANKLPTGTTLVWIKRHPELFGSFLSDAEIGWLSTGYGVYVHYKQFPPPLRAMELGGDAANPFTSHPTQKPISLMVWCLGLVPDAQTILDPFMGSGTTLVAAKQLGRKAIGIELEEKYCAIAAHRLCQEYLPLGEPIKPAIQMEVLL